MDNLEASVVILRKLTEQWNDFSVKQSSLEALGETLSSFKNMVHFLPISHIVTTMNLLLS